MNENEIVAVEEPTAAISNLHQLELVDVEYAAQVQQNFLDLVDVLLDKSDYQAGKKKKSAWRKLARAFNISDEPITKEIVRDENHQIISAYFEVKAILPNGRSGFGVGDCSIFDKIKSDDVELPSNFELRKRFTNAEHDVIATAHTRAKSRAISDLIGAGEVSAEELDDAVKVTRNSRNNNGSSTKSADNTESKPKTTKRRGRRVRKSESEVIETKAEVVSDNESDTSNSDDEFESIENKSVQMAILRIKNAGETVSKASIVDELFDLYNLGDIDEDEYSEGKKAIGL